MAEPSAAKTTELERQAPETAHAPLRVEQRVKPVNGDVSTGPTGAIGASAAPAPSPPLTALGRALATRDGCREPERLSDIERRACESRLAAAPLIRLRESNPYAIVNDQVALMSGVRRRENSQRFGCELSRNLDSTCPNALPDNKPIDYERPKPAPNRN